MRRRFQRGASTATGARRAVPIPLRHDQVHRLQMLRGRMQRANGNPADILFRRVGEIEGGVYPDTQRNYLSMGCNHCVEPTCMTGCPVDAYSKDGPTGIVRHSAEICIGCQYCTWNCSYGVPQYNPDRGVVGKCDMCYGRLTQGQQPACVSACPEGAIQIEVVHTAEWRKEYATKQIRRGCRQPTIASQLRASPCLPKCRAMWASESPSCQAGASSLATGCHDGSDATLSRRFHIYLAS